MAEIRKNIRGRVTLSQVARHAGVSATTASLVLGNKSHSHRISETTLLRVKQAARELDYAPNLLVRSMQQGQTQVLSFLNAFRHRDVDDRYMDKLSTAIQRAAGKQGYDVLVHCDFSRSPEGTYRFLNGGRADGLIFFAPRRSDPLLPLLRQSRLPVVLINAEDEEGILSSVRDDVQSGMMQVASKLHEYGHKHIAAFTETEMNNPDAPERIRLLRESLSKFSIDLPEIRVMRYSKDAKSPLSVIMDSPSPPTAIFCWSDRIAYDLLEQCDRHGITVPDQLSIIGYDGLPWPAATRHQAASITVDLTALAEDAVQLLATTIRCELQKGVQQVIPVNLSLGTTLGPIIS